MRSNGAMTETIDGDGCLWSHTDLGAEVLAPPLAGWLF